MPNSFPIDRPQAPFDGSSDYRRLAAWVARCVSLLALLALEGGCATVRVTDPTHSATEQFLLTGALQQAIQQLSMDGLRDQLVYLDSSYLFPPLQASMERELLLQPALEHAFLLGELRAKLLREGVRLTPTREGATVIVEVRSGGVGIDRYEFLLGLPAATLGSAASSAASSTASVATASATPELAILKTTKQRGFASVAIVAYRAKTGELVAQSGPFIGRTLREDYWIFGTGPRTVGNIPPSEK